MAKFKFKAKKISGEEMEDSREAADRFDLARKLRQEGYILIDCKEEGAGKKKLDLAFVARIFSRVTLAEKMIFTRNLGVMVGAGLAVTRALDVLIRQAKSPKFKKVLAQISESVSKGKPLSESMAMYPDVFSGLFTSMLKAGERSGNLQESLKLLAEQMNQDYMLRRKIKGAMVYPAIIMVAMIGIAVVMLIYVVPTLVSVFEEMDIELPMSTRLIIWLSKSLVTNALMIGAFFVALAGGAYWFLKTEFAKKVIGVLTLKMPLLSGIVRKVNSARTARTLSSLINSGVEILESLEITANLLQNVKYKKVLIEAKDEIQKGATISSAFKKYADVYPPLLSEMIAVGEETGNLSGMLLNIAVFYEEEVTEATKDMSTIIEPILMILIGAVVGFFAVAMMRPMYSMIGGM